MEDACETGFCAKSETVAGGSICAGADEDGCAAGARGISRTLVPPLFPLLPNIPDPDLPNYFRKPRIFVSSGESRSFFCFLDSARPVIAFAI